MTKCRFCGTALEAVFADLGMSPLANSYLTPEQGNAMEPFYPLRALVCDQCFLVQLEEYESPSHIFSDYAYFSSYSSSWLDHSRRYVEAMIERFGYDGSSHVVEIASNDGYLLQFFKQRGVPVLGVEPAANVAEVAVDRGIPTVVEFFGRRTAAALARDRGADLLLGNNVLAHVPDLNDFVGGNYNGELAAATNKQNLTKMQETDCLACHGSDAVPLSPHVVRAAGLGRRQGGAVDEAVRRHSGWRSAPGNRFQPGHQRATLRALSSAHAATHAGRRPDAPPGAGAQATR